MNIKHILLIEVLLRGHRIVWLENITSIFLKDGNCVTIAILKDFDRLANSIFDYLPYIVYILIMNRLRVVLQLGLLAKIT